MNIGHPARLIWTIRQLRFLSGGLAFSLLASCGCGCGGGATSFQSVAMAGELIDYTVDTTPLTYA